MGDVDAYIASLTAGRERSELIRLHGLITAHVPGVGQSTSYGMACYTYRDKPVAAVVVRKRHIAWYPFSGRVLPAVRGGLEGYSTSPGTLRFTADAALPDDLVRQLLDIRLSQIDHL